MGKKIFVLGFEIDLDDLGKRDRITQMGSAERRAAYSEEENPGGVYELDDWFVQFNASQINDEGYFWLTVKQ